MLLLSISSGSTASSAVPPRPAPRCAHLSTVILNLKNLGEAWKCQIPYLHQSPWSSELQRKAVICLEGCKKTL